jgi:membrane peptidoglycan carboxypeptidase
MPPKVPHTSASGGDVDRIITNNLRTRTNVGPLHQAKTRTRLSLARRASRRRFHRRAIRKLQSLALVVATAGAMLLIAGAPVADAMVAPLLPIAHISSAGLPQDLLVYDRHGTLLADIAQQGDHRIVVPLGSVAPMMLKATIAIEDRSFYHNGGLDLLAIARAAVDDLKSGRIVQGGSTITQQLAKQLFIGPRAPATLQRKLKEAVLAMVLTNRYSKSTILEAYLNTIYYSDQAYGVEAAAEAYFHTTAARLTLAQASLLAGLPRAPTAYNPILHPQAAHQRQLEVLAAMVKEGYVSVSQARLAGATRLDIFPPTNAVLAPHFVRYVLDILRQKFQVTPWTGRAVRVFTSLDLPLQDAAEQAVQVQVSGPGQYYNFHDAALASLDPQTGEILAMVGSAPGNRANGDIDMATSPTRQVGSAFKIFTYTAAIANRKVNMTSPILDAPLAFPIGGPNNGPYIPANYDLRWHGVVPLKVALGNSLNIPGIKAELYTGIPEVLNVARRMGVTTLTQPDSTYGPSLTLGSYPVPVIDMAVGAATLADLGIRREPTAILRMTDALGRPIYDYDPSQNMSQAVSPQVAFIMGAILSDDRNRWMEFGPGGDLTLPGRQVAAKTGTSQNFRDNWTLGYTPTLATAVWVGNPDGTPLSHSSTGIVGAAPIWHQFMNRALVGVPNQWYAMPDGVDQVGGDYFLQGTEHMPPVLAGPWPGCPFSRYNPNQLTWSSIMVAGVPCTLGTNRGRFVNLSSSFAFQPPH